MSFLLMETSAVRFSEDGLLYRARIMDVGGDGVTAEVLFVDYGNRDTCSELYQLGPELRQLPVGAHPVRILLNSGVEENQTNMEILEDKLNSGQLQVHL